MNGRANNRTYCRRASFTAGVRSRSSPVRYSGNYLFTAARMGNQNAEIVALVVEDDPAAAGIGGKNAGSVIDYSVLAGRGIVSQDFEEPVDKFRTS